MMIAAYQSNRTSTFQHKRGVPGVPGVPCVPGVPVFRCSGVPVFNIKNLLNESWQLKDNELTSC